MLYGHARVNRSFILKPRARYRRSLFLSTSKNPFASNRRDDFTRLCAGRRWSASAVVIRPDDGTFSKLLRSRGRPLNPPNIPSVVKDRNDATRQWVKSTDLIESRVLQYLKVGFLRDDFNHVRDV